MVAGVFGQDGLLSTMTIRGDSPGRGPAGRRAVEIGELQKKEKYLGHSSDVLHEFIPLVHEQFGCVGKEAACFIHAMARVATARLLNVHALELWTQDTYDDATWPRDRDVTSVCTEFRVR